MFSIGDFARLGRVSVRMLRHYDAIGLLVPVVVDPVNGYRRYDADQLRRLNRVIALKDLGFTLQQVQAILDDRVDVAELRGMLRLRRAQLEAQLEADAARLVGVEARLRMIEREGRMNTEDVVLKQVPPVRVAELSATAAGYGPEHIGPVITPMYPELHQRLAAAGVAPTGPAIAYYEPAPGGTGDGEPVTVHAGIPVTSGPGTGTGFTVVDLPAIPAAATIVHHGPMDDVMASIQTLARWIEDNGYRPVGYHREVYLEYSPDQADQGVTELQIEIVKD
ncbi:MerR family transcriptional regulator [Rugosimonospora acidiphila]|uniref:MerR family transcriptional regulator n=1 Tax=Rugosimonospora acidiphila TaxID=556531 RepID=A0ABP9SPZ7_9ACTN